MLASLPDFTALTTGSSNLSVDLTRFRPILFIASAIIAFIIVLNTVIIPVQRRTAAIEKYGIELVTGDPEGDEWY
mgnify:CR=1 FL=1